jgi:hypothetical protein
LGDTWPTLAFFLLNQLSPNQAISTRSLLLVFKGFKSGLMLMFQLFAFFGYLFQGLGEIFSVV